MLAVCVGFIVIIALLNIVLSVEYFRQSRARTEAKIVKLLQETMLEMRQADVMANEEMSEKMADYILENAPPYKRNPETRTALKEIFILHFPKVLATQDLDERKAIALEASKKALHYLYSADLEYYLKNSQVSGKPS